MSWIKMRGNLWDDPRIARICDLLGKREAEVIGGLYWIWSMADEQTDDGELVGLSVATIDRKTGIKGLGESLLTIGWIEQIPDGLNIVRFEEHNGSSAKRRATEAKRKHNFRNESATSPQRKRTKIGHPAQLDKIRVYTPIVPKGTDAELELTAESEATPATPDLEHLALSRARMLFRKRDSTPLDQSEDRSWKKNKGAVCATSEQDWLLLEWFYAQGSGKGDAGEFRRTQFSTLLNNWNGEISRASEEARNRGVAIGQKKEGGGGIPEPEGWRKLLVEIFDETTEDAEQNATWAQLPQSVKQQILDRLNGGAA